MSNNITISDVAEALGVSKTTVSRAISGKGRIGAATRKRVLEYIQEHDYKPNVIARGLAQSKTFNICVVMPGDYALVDLPFFQEAIMGIQEIAGMMEYDLLLCIGSGNDMAGLRRIIQNHKVDGVVLLRTMVDDPVSRAISGKGRIGAATRKRVLEYIQEHDYKPNVIARGLAQSKTFNICVVMPGDYALVDLPFFQEAIMGIQEIAGMMEYDLLLCIGSGNDMAGLRRIIQNHKVDGVVLLRTMVDDPQVTFLQERRIPFVTAGSCKYKDVKQIDHDHRSACRELTSIMLMRGMKNMALLGGSEDIVVNQTRYAGVVDAHELFGKKINDNLVFLNLEGKAYVEKAVDDAIDRGCDCLLCMDDAVCAQVMRRLRERHIKVPQQVKVASFYNSSVLENNVPSITSLSFDSKELGARACKNLLRQIEGEETENRTLLPYEVVLKESTQ